MINFEIRDFPPIPSDVTLATDPHPPCVMKPIIGLSVAGLLVLIQLAGLATRRAEPVIYLTPIDGAAAGHGHCA